MLEPLGLLMGRLYLSMALDKFGPLWTLLNIFGWLEAGLGSSGLDGSSGSGWVGWLWMPLDSFG